MKASRLAAGAVVILGASTFAAAAPVVFSAGGTSDPASIQPTVDAFRAALGSPNNGNAPGTPGAGRREINWDGGGAVTASPAGTPFVGFQVTRGATFTTPGAGFLQTPIDAPELSGINPTYPQTFNDFSPLRVFTPLASNVVDVDFNIPGSTDPAAVRGFGAIFSDVDLPNTTSLQFFDLNGISMGTFFVPPASDTNGGFSFLGVLFSGGELIDHVRFTLGSVPLGPIDNPGAGADVVVMDDVLYGEPVPLGASTGDDTGEDTSDTGDTGDTADAGDTGEDTGGADAAAVPEPVTASLAALAIAALGVSATRRRR